MSLNLHNRRKLNKMLFVHPEVFQTGCNIFAFSPAMYESTDCSTSLLAFGIVSFQDLGHSNRCIVVSHYCFNLDFPDDMGYRTSCQMLFAIYIWFFGEVSDKVFGSFLIVLIVLCVFWITVLYQKCLQIFSPRLLLVFQFSWYCLSKSICF